MAIVGENDGTSSPKVEGAPEWLYGNDADPGDSCSARPRRQQQGRAAGLYAAVLLVGNVVISAVKPKVHAHCPFPSPIAYCDTSLPRRA